MSRLEELIAEYCPNGVQYCSLEDVCTISKGTQFNKADMMDEGTYPVINGGINPSGYIELYNQEKDTITISQGGASAGYVNWQQTNFWAGAHCYILKPVDTVDNRYLFHFVKSQEKKLQECQYGAGIPALGKATVANLRIPVPLLPVQREIARILDNFTELTVELTVELSKEVTCLGEQQKYYLNKLVSSANDYETKLLRELVSVKMCKRIKKDQTVSEGGVPFYKNGTLGRKADSYISLELYEEYLQRYPFPQKGAVMLSTAGTVGRAYIYDGKPAYFQDSNVVWLENDETVISNEYLYWFCTSMPWKLPTRGTIKHLHNDMILDTPITIPPREAQEEFVGFLKNSIHRFSEIHDCLLSEIDARQKQYVYYRDKLLTFKEKPTD